VSVPGSEAQAVLRGLERRFPDQAGGQAVVVFGRHSGRVDQGASREAVAAAVARVRRVPHVRTVIDPTGPFAPLLTSADGRTSWAQVVWDRDSFEVPRSSVDRLVEVATSAAGDGMRVGVGGQAIERPDVESTRTGEVIGLVAAVVVLAVAFGSVGAVSLPLLLAAVVVGAGFALTRLLAAWTEVNLATQAMATMIGLAVGIDYALFVLSRHRHALAAGTAVPDAVARAVDTAGRSVLFAGTTVMISMLGLLAIGVPAVSSMAVAVSATVVVAMAATVTLLPAVLGIVGTRIDTWRVPFTRLHTDDDATSDTWSTRWAGAVVRRPVTALIAGTAVLLLLAVPFLSLRTGWPDARNRPAGDPARTAFDLMTEGFGIGANAPLLVAIDTGDPATVATVRSELQDLRGVRAVTPPLTNATGDTTLVQVTPTTGPESPATADLVRRIRDSATLAAAAPVGVTGATAFYIDLDQRMSSRLPWFVAAVVAFSLVLLTLVFRAPLVAVKAAAMNLLGIAAAYGAVVAVFQWGWARQLVGLERPVPIVSSLPVVMFAVLFGLSMDYEVFILSRVREAWTRSGDNTRAVIEGLGASSRVVTAAAAIMFVVFAGFTTADPVEIKTTGFGLAVAVLLDATIIRQVLVPATMVLLGERNWWIPRWLDRRLPHLDIEGHAPDVAVDVP
jgi:RND superfamily putative drug exporter